MKDLVIFDFGTSKIKTSINKYDNFELFQIESIVTNISIGKLLSNNIIATEEKIQILKDFKDRVKTLVKQFSKEEFNIITIATEIFRKNKELRVIIKQLMDEFSIPLEILTPERECELLAANFDLIKSDLLLDIGGGSVNIVYKFNNKLNSFCYGLGAYVLNNIFQSKGEIFNNTIYASMDQYIKTIINSYNIVNKEKFTRIILGSNQMLSFFNNLSKKTGLNFMNNGSFNSNIISGLINKFFLNKKYEDLFQYCDKNPKFMYGADKMLLILQNFIEFFNVKIISPTDYGITSGYAKMCANKTCNQ